MQWCKNIKRAGTCWFTFFLHLRVFLYWHQFVIKLAVCIFSLSCCEFGGQYQCSGGLERLIYEITLLHVEQDIKLCSLQTCILNQLSLSISISFCAANCVYVSWMFSTIALFSSNKLNDVSIRRVPQKSVDAEALVSSGRASWKGVFLQVCSKLHVSSRCCVERDVKPYKINSSYWSYNQNNHTVV